VNKNIINAGSIGQVIAADSVGTVTYTPDRDAPAGEAAGRAAMEKRARAPAAAARCDILFLGSNPSNTARLAIGQEVREIERRLRAAADVGPGRLALCAEWAVRATDVQAHLLRHRPAIVHFSGHATRGAELVLEDDAGQAKPVSAAALVDLFQQVAGTVRCVVMNACFSDLHAAALVDHVDCVVSMTDAMDDQAAVAFASAYYQALAFGKSVEAAFGLGRSQIRLEGLAYADVPRLRVRPGARADTLHARNWFDAAAT
jgi:hypothetical protein